MLDDTMLDDTMLYDTRDTTTKQGTDVQRELREDELLRTERAIELSERALMRIRIGPWMPRLPRVPSVPTWPLP
jgi:hypothetical protein